MKYNPRIPLLFATGLVLSAPLLRASDDFADGDLAIAFYSVTGSGSQAVFGTGYYVVNLGPASLYRENSLNNVPVSTINTALASSNISADLSAVFGPSWAQDGLVRWLVVGSVSQTGALTNGDPARTFYFSAVRGSLNSGETGSNSSSAFPATISLSNRTGTCNSITTALQEGTNWGITATNGNTSIPGSNAAGVRLSTSNTKSLDDFIPPVTSLYFTLGDAAITVTPAQTFSAGTLSGSAGVEGALDIYRVLHTTTTADLTAGASSGNAAIGIGQYIGALTIDSSGNLKIAGVGPAAGNFSTWAATNNVTGGANGDSDNDGISNLAEYALALNPAGPDGASGTFTGGTLAFTKRAEAVTNNDVTYAIQESDDVGLTDAWQTVAPTTNTASAITYALPPGSPKKFTRLVVTTNP